MWLDKRLLKGSIILLVSYNIFNLLNFVFQLAMVRLLTLAEYGALATLFSMTYFLGVFTYSIESVMINYSSKEKDDGKLKNFLKRSLKKSLKASVLFFALYLIIAIPLSGLFKISYLLMFLNGLITFSSFLLPVPRGILQGKKRFSSCGLNLILEATIKLSFAIIIVLFFSAFMPSFKIYGSVISVLISGIVAFFAALFSLRNIIKSKESKAYVEGIYQYSAPVFFSTLALMAFYNLDVIIARAVFSQDLSGAYAMASTLGKIVFFGTFAISRAMFSISSENKNDRSQSTNLFSNSLVVLLLCITLALLIFSLFPEKIISFFSGKEVGAASGILFYVILAFSLISVSNLVIMHKLSLGNLKGYLPLFLSLLVEVFLLYSFSSSLESFSISFVIASAIFLLGCIFLLKNENNHNNPRT